MVASGSRVFRSWPDRSKISHLWPRNLVPIRSPVHPQFVHRTNAWTHLSQTILLLDNFLRVGWVAGWEKFPTRKLLSQRFLFGRLWWNLALAARSDQQKHSKKLSCRWQTARRVRGQSRSTNMAPFHTLCVVSYECAVVPLSLTRAVFHIFNFRNIVTLKSGSEVT